MKKHEPVWSNVVQADEYGFLLDYSWPEIIDYRSVEFPPEDQTLMQMRKFQLPRFQFMVRPASAEGTISQKVYRMSIARLDVGQYPDAQAVGKVLGFLRQKCGTPIEMLLAEIRARQQSTLDQAQKRVKVQHDPATIDASPQYEQTNPVGDKSTSAHPLSSTAASDDAEPKIRQGRLHEDFWR